MTRLKHIGTVLALSSMLASASATAAPIQNLFNTGVDSSGSALSGGAVDPNYELIQQPGSGLSVTATPVDGFPIPPWVANNASSRWIGPNTDDADGPPGDYVFRTTFDLPANADLSSVSISGLWAADNEGTDIQINGTGTGNAIPGSPRDFESLTSFTITSGFVTGVNILDFAVTNAGSGPNNTGNDPNPVGLRVDEIAGSFEVSAGVQDVPVPFTLGLLGFGLTVLGTVFRRRI
jgi:hypothetical protein